MNDDQRAILRAVLDTLNEREAALSADMSRRIAEAVKTAGVPPTTPISVVSVPPILIPPASVNVTNDYAALASAVSDALDRMGERLGQAIALMGETVSRQIADLDRLASHLGQSVALMSETVGEKIAALAEALDKPVEPQPQPKIVLPERAERPARTFVVHHEDGTESTIREVRKLA